MNINTNTESTETQGQVVSFADQTPQWKYSIENPIDSANMSTDNNDADLNNFFSRPIKIASINWTVGSTFGTTINPWELYFSNLRVINRISNYNLMRSKLCVRIMINGNGFHYGRALASYRPLHGVDDMIAWRIGLFPQDIIAASQRMHVWIDPTNSQGGTLCLPFVYYFDNINVVDQAWNNMGELDIGSVTTLEHANGGTDAVTISVFAWAEDVSLAIPTIAEPGSLAPQLTLRPQAGDEADQASRGPISSPAAAVAEAAGSLKQVPVISKYATAAEFAARGVGNVARMFGLSRPVDTGPLHAYKPTFVGNMPNTNTLDTSTKLTYDVRQEVTVDPGAMNMGAHDEMSITSIATRESYLTQFEWATTSVPETLLWNCYVDPVLFDTASVLGTTEYHLTPMGYAALPFYNWKGSINYRFQVVASAFHKGRLKIVFEPYLNALGATEYNVQETHIIDLAKERDFTVSVGWGQDRSYLKVDDLISVPFSTSAFGSSRSGSANGMIGVYVVNDLTTPSSDVSSVPILVSVSAGDDFAVVNPADNIDDKVFWEPQSIMEWDEQANMPDADDTTDEAAPVTTTIEKSFATDDPALSADLQYFGDPVTSLRQVLKRYEFYRTHNYQDIEQMMYTTLPDFPMYAGYATGLNGGVENAATPVDPTPYNYCQPTMLNWFTPLYLCRRGGIRHKFIFSSDAQASAGTMSVTRIAKPIGYTRFARPLTSAVSRSSGVFASISRGMPGHSGVVTTPVALNPVLEVDIPYHPGNCSRFKPARRKNQNTISALNSFHQLSFPTTTIPGGATVVNYVAAADDYSLGFFQACPVIYKISSVPAPSATD